MPRGNFLCGFFIPGKRCMLLSRSLRGRCARFAREHAVNFRHICGIFLRGGFGDKIFKNLRDCFLRRSFRLCGRNFRLCGH